MNLLEYIYFRIYNFINYVVEIKVKIRKYDWFLKRCISKKDFKDYISRKKFEKHFRKEINNDNYKVSYKYYQHDDNKYHNFINWDYNLCNTFIECSFDNNQYRHYKDNGSFTKIDKDMVKFSFKLFFYVLIKKIGLFKIDIEKENKYIVKYDMPIVSKNKELDIKDKYDLSSDKI